MEKNKNIEEDKKIETVIKKSLESSTLDLTIDYAELGLDSFLDNDGIKEIPIVKSIVGTIKGGLAIREIFFAKKLLTFLKEFHKQNLNAEKISEFKNKINTDEKYRNKVIEKITVMNERFISIEKSKVLANLFKAHLNGKFDWDIFNRLCECLDSIPTIGFRILTESETSENPFHFKTYESEKDGGGILLASGICTIHGNHYSINGYGQHLYFYGIKGDIDYNMKE